MTDSTTATKTSTDTFDPIEDTGADELLSDLRAWLGSNWDPDLTVGEWWERLGLAGWSAPGLPENAYGKGMARADAVLVAKEIAAFGALGAPAGLGLLLAAPTIATHGTQEQIDLYVRDIVTGQKAWCQLFSEPQAGSDLAGLQTKAVRDGDEWIINGQKVWTSGGQYADLGMLLARTDPDVPKHRRDLVLRLRDAPAGRRRAAAQGDDRSRAFQRGVPHRRPGGRLRSDRGSEQRMGGRQYHPDERAGRTGFGRGQRRRWRHRPNRAPCRASGRTGR